MSQPITPGRYRHYKGKDWVVHFQFDKLFNKLQQQLVRFRQIPVKPTDLIILTIRIVIPLLCTA